MAIMAAGWVTRGSVALLLLLAYARSPPTPNDSGHERDGKCTEKAHSDLYRTTQKGPAVAAALKTKSKSKRFFGSRIAHTVNSCSSFQIEGVILACGDVSPNPGPGKRQTTKFPCGECGRNVRNNHDAILCCSCDTWSHAKCLKLSKTCHQYYFAHPEVDWTCTRCALPVLSDSFFQESCPDEINASTDTANIDTMQAADVKRVRDNNPKECIIANLNINSLPNKFDEVKEWLELSIFDVLALQETKIDRTFPNTQFEVEGYKLFRRDRVKGGGGIAVFIRDNITVIRKRHASKSVELLLFDMHLGQRRFTLINAYKPPSVDNATFTKEMFSALDKATSVCENIICLGDLNCDLLHPLAHNKQGRCLLDICDTYDLDSLINQATRISTNRSSCLDVILTSVPAYIKESGTNGPSNTSTKSPFSQT